MGLFDSLVGGVLQNVLGGQAGTNPAANPGGLGQILEGALGNTQFGGLQGVLSQLEASGLGAHVQSWLGPGGNLPISADEIRSALGNEQLQKLAAQFGVPLDQVSQLMAQYLPATVDHLSPNGELQVPTT